MFGAGIFQNEYICKQRSLTAGLAKTVVAAQVNLRETAMERCFQDARRSIRRLDQRIRIAEG